MEVSTPVWLIISFKIISEHFKMYITINDIKGEKRIDLFYLIKNFDFAEIAVVNLFSNNIQYNIKKLCSVMDSDSKELIPSRELLSVLEGMVVSSTIPSSTESNSLP